MNKAQRRQDQHSHFANAKWWRVAANDDDAAGFQPALFRKPKLILSYYTTRRDCSNNMDVVNVSFAGEKTDPQSSGIHSIHGDNNITAESYGNGVSTTRSFYDNNGLAQNIKTGVSGDVTKFQNLSYQWDSAANLYQRTSASTGAIIDGLGESLTESFTYDTGHRLKTANTSGTTGGASLSRSLSYDYDALGNITSKTGVGSYTYSGVGAGPHAVTSTTGAYANSYVYDPKGNMTSNGSKTLTYTTYNLPASISDSVSGSTVAFTYGPQEQMIYQTATENSITTESKYYEGEYEEVQQGDVIRAKTTLNGVLVYSTVRKENSVAQGYDISYVHEDHLGSTDSVTSKTATLDTRMLFDPFGSRRKPSGADADATYLASLQKTTFETTSNGYTGHEQIDSVQLVHMGGRMYDPVLGRFLSTDANIQYPEISQSYNRYSYVLNNPLSMVDPSGETAETTKTEGEKKEKGLIEKAVDAVKTAIGAAVDAVTETKGTGSDKATQTQTAQDKANVDSLASDEKRQKLVTTQDDARNNPDFVKKGAITYCNQATLQTAKDVNAPTTDLVSKDGTALKADEMRANLKTSAEYKEITPQQATQAANQGNLVIVGGPGHVATVRPENVKGDNPPPNGKGALLNNIGASNRVQNENWTFKKEDRDKLEFYTPK